MLDDIITAIALLLVIEGIFPFISPQKWKEMFSQVTQLPDKSLRVMGFISMLVGVLLLYFNVH